MNDKVFIEHHSTSVIEDHEPGGRVVEYEPAPVVEHHDAGDPDDNIKRLIEEALAALPKPQNGKDADPKEVKRLFDIELARLPLPTPPEVLNAKIEEAALAAAAKIIATLPKPRDGEDGDDGEDGKPGDRGPIGPNGWSPVLAAVSDGERVVHKVIDWIGSNADADTKPPIGLFVAEQGFVADIRDAKNIRGPAGPRGRPGHGGGGTIIQQGGGTGTGGGAVSSVFGRIGVVDAEAGDYTASQIEFVPSGTIAADDVQEAIEELDTDIQAFQAELDSKAPLDSPAFIGNPTAPTPTPGDNDTSIATTGFVKAAIDVVLGGVSSAFDTLAELAAAIATKANSAVQIIAGAGLTGGGDLSADRTINVGAGSGIQVNADDVATTAPTMRSDTTQALNVGFTHTSFNIGTISSGTLTPSIANGHYQHYTNSGAHTLAPPTANGSIVIECTNSSAGAITTSGFSRVTGDTFNTSGTNKHLLFITKTNTQSELHIVFMGSVSVGGPLMTYEFDTATSGDPGTGKFLFNNATFGLSNTFHISETDYNGVGGRNVFFSAIDNGLFTNKALVFLSKVDGSGSFAFWITGVLSDQGNYDTFSITPIGGSGTRSDGDIFNLLIIPVDQFDVEALTEDTAVQSTTDWILVKDVSAAGYKKALAGRRIIQIVTAGSASQTSVVGTTFTTTAVAASITPKSSNNQVLVLVGGVLVSNTANAQAVCKIRRAGTDLAPRMRAGGSNSTAIASGAMIILDSPATTSSTTYDTQVASDTGGATAIFPFDHSTITLIELAPA